VSDKLCEVVSEIDADKVSISINRNDALYADSEKCELYPVFTDPGFNEEVFNYVASLIKRYFVGPINKAMGEADTILLLNSVLREMGIAYDVFQRRFFEVSTANSAGFSGEYGDFNVVGGDLLYISADDDGNWVEVIVGIGSREVVFDFRFLAFFKFKEGAPKLSKGFGEGVERFLSSVNSLMSREGLSRVFLFGLFP